MNIGHRLDEIIARVTNMGSAMLTLARRVEVIENTKGGAGTGASRTRGYQNIVQLGSDKFGFRLWHERFINEFTQVHPAARQVIKKINNVFDPDDRMATTEELELGNQNIPGLNATKFIEDLFYILSAKCDGDAAIKVV